MQDTGTGDLVNLAPWLNEIPLAKPEEMLTAFEQRDRLNQAIEAAIPDPKRRGPLFEVGEIIEIKGGKFRVNGFSQKRLYLDSLPSA